jgi:hypothetical protein
MIKVIFQRLKTLEQLLWLFNMDKLTVEGHPDLYRDPKTGAIINNNTNEYESYIKTYRARNIEKQKMNHIEFDLNELKKEISEIKNLLSQLASN